MTDEVKKYLSDESEKLYKDKISECEEHIKKQSHRINYLESQLKEDQEEHKANIKYLYQALKDRRGICDKLEAENKKLTESIDALLILIDSRLSLFDSDTIGKARGKSLIWKRVVKTAQELIKEK